MASGSERFALAVSALGREQPGSSPALFAYGSLLIDEVMAALIDRVPEYEIVTAPGYRVCQLPGLFYPGLVHDEPGEAPGRIYLGLSPEEWAILDAWENPLYEVQVVGLTDGRKALAYVWTLDLSKEHLKAESWTTAHMSGAVLDDYLANTKAWRERYKSQTEAS